MVDVVLLKKEIDDLNIPISTLASKCHVARQTINKWLSDPKLISAYHARILADALRISEPDKLLAIFFAPNVEEYPTNE